MAEHIIWENETEESEYNIYDLEDIQLCYNISTQGQIIAIADLGLWNGRRSGFKFIGYNISDCFMFTASCEYGSFYCNQYDLVSRQHHHDGTNYITYRELKPNISERQKCILCNKLYNNTATRKDIVKYTRSLRPYIKNVYGW